MVGMTRSKVIFFSLLKVWINTKAKARRATRRVAMPIVGRIPSTYNERMIRGTSWKPCKCHSLATQPATAVSYGSNATTDATKHLSAKYCAKCSKDFFRNQSIFYDFDQKKLNISSFKVKKGQTTASPLWQLCLSPLEKSLGHVDIAKIIPTICKQTSGVVRTISPTTV